MDKDRLTGPPHRREMGEDVKIQTLTDKLTRIMADRGAGEIVNQRLEIHGGFPGESPLAGIGFDGEVRSRFSHTTTDHPIRLEGVDRHDHRLASRLSLNGQTT